MLIIHIPMEDDLPLQCTCPVTSDIIWGYVNIILRTPSPRNKLTKLNNNDDQKKNNNNN